MNEQVSSLKKGHVPPSEDAEGGFGIIHSTFIWNATKGRADSRESADQSSNFHRDNADDRQFQLQDIDVMFPEGQLSVVTGPTASGKTALLMALLGELTTLKGRIVMSKNASKIDEYGLAHTISYASQTPWLRHESIRNNILFGFPYDEERYNAVLECCALRPDLEILEDGDATEIGARFVVYYMIHPEVQGYSPIACQRSKFVWRSEGTVRTFSSFPIHVTEWIYLVWLSPARYMLSVTDLHGSKVQADSSGHSRRSMYSSTTR